MTDYLTSAQLKATLSITGTASDADVSLAITAASRAIEEYYRLNHGRPIRFYPTAETRYYTPPSYCYERTMEIDDFVKIDVLAVDRTKDYSYSETWTEGTDFVTEPANNYLESKPKRQIVRVPRVGRPFPEYPQSVKVTGTFGWTTAPALITQAASILAARFYQRRNTPFGILAVGVDSAAAARLPRTDPDVVALLDAVDSNVPRLFA